MIDILDMHTHTLVSGHAYNTIREMTKAAKEKGLQLLGITEHAPMMPGTCCEMYFSNMGILDRSAYEVPVLFGAELNILNTKGEVDLSEGILAGMDYCIASLHSPCIAYMPEKESTQAILNAIENPYVQIIAHPDDGRYPLQFDEVAAAAKEHHVLLEVNNASLSPNGFRLNSRENYFKMLEKCEKYGTEIIMDSDAHADTYVGNHQYACALIEEYGFPKELIVNSSVERFMSYVNHA